MGFQVMIFELSTPFLHLRKYLLQTRATDGAAFLATQLAFAATFFLSRIAFGFVACAGWAAHMVELLRAGSIRSPPVVVMYMVMCALSCALNARWMYQIVRAGCAGARRPPAKAKEV